MPSFSLVTHNSALLHCCHQCDYTECKNKIRTCPSIALSLQFQLTQARKIYSYGDHAQSIKEGEEIASWDPDDILTSPSGAAPGTGGLRGSQTLLSSCQNLLLEWDFSALGWGQPSPTAPLEA